MIQRKQTLWLFLASVFAILTFRFPFYTGELSSGAPTNPAVFNTLPVNSLVDLNATTMIWLTILTVLTGGLAFTAIFLFRNRSTQLKFVYLGIFLSLLLLAGYFYAMSYFSRGTIAIWSIFPFATLIFFILAAQGIRKDAKLIKSLDRLR